MRFAKVHILVFIFFMSVINAQIVVAQTAAPVCDSCSSSVAPQVIAKEGENWGETAADIIIHVKMEFTALQYWMKDDPRGLFRGFWLPAFQQMTAQLSAVAMQQSMIFGSFLDAKHQLETQQSLQKISARAHKDYQPSVGLCEFGSSAKSLAASERKGEYNALVMSKRSRDRELGSSGTAAATGKARDKTARFEQFKKMFCDPNDSNGALQNVCEKQTVATPTTPNAPAPESKINKDIDYARTIDMPWTLDVDFTDSKIDGTNEPEVLALASNLYSHDIFSRDDVALGNGGQDSQKEYMNKRSVIAKRSVAENSYNAIVGMKSAGTAGSKDYLQALMLDLGVSSADATKMIGENPSYYAQMEILTKKLYQNPDFYTNLYDTPVNVARKGVALQAINLMQKFDLLKSYLRNEASMSVLLEIALIEIQKELEK